MRIVLMLLIVVLTAGCATVAKDTRGLEVVIDDYFDTYDKRIDFEHLMSFYDDTATLQDIIYGNDIKGKKQIKKFLAWDQGEFSTFSQNGVLTITDQAIDNNIVITRGYFHAFTFNKQKLGPWRFVMIHEFNDEQKIIKQTDWINYTPRANFLGGKDMNHLIKEKEFK